ncbi:MAG: ABC transporter ATP-binding protein [Candidatus Omnitrophota bacterium]
MNTLLEIKNLKKYFPTKKGGLARAVDGVSLALEENQTLGIVGESGCGKTTLAKMVLKLIRPDQGVITFNGLDLTRLSQAQFRPYRRLIQIIFQDPYSSLDPRFTVRKTLLEAAGAIKSKMTNQDIERQLLTVGLAKDIDRRFSFEFSGGQCQRINLARALIVMPKLLILDEAVSSLDVSLQARIIELLSNLKDRFGISYLFISHNLRIVRKISDIIAVMYLGKILELASAQRLFSVPLNPYTQALISAAADKNVVLKGEVASNTNIPEGCRFNSRCLYVKDICRHSEPALEEKEAGHFSACHFADNFLMRPRLSER